MLDVFAHYERCLDEMGRRLRPEDQSEFQVLRARLIENLSSARLFGDTPTRQSDRSMLLHTLNTLASSALGVTFDAIAKTLRPVGKRSSVDIIVYVALGEEFSLALRHFGKEFARDEIADIAATVYRGTVSITASEPSCRVLIVPAGTMGNTRSSGLMSAVLATNDTRNVVALGIAGSIGDDLQLGDVFMPQSVNEYMANTAGVGGETLSFLPSGNRLPIDPRLLNRAQFFQINHSTEHRNWSRREKRRWKSLVSEAMLNRLKSAGIDLRGHSRLLSGDDKILGSGPAVSKGVAFARWIRASARKTEAVEMESAGVLDAAFIRTPAPRVLVIRGISDYGDDRKNLIEAASKGAFRELAIDNATDYLMSAIRAGLFCS